MCDQNTLDYSIASFYTRSTLYFGTTLLTICVFFYQLIA
nr:MAG TPA: hypothetical protein [Caudoviricetes sp.]